MTEEYEKQYETRLQKIIDETVRKNTMEVTLKHIELMDKIEELNKNFNILSEQIQPVTKVYNAFDGLGNVLNWVFKIVIVPLSVIIGIYYSIKQIIHG